MVVVQILDIGVYTLCYDSNSFAKSKNIVDVAYLVIVYFLLKQIIDIVLADTLNV